MVRNMAELENSLACRLLVSGLTMQQMAERLGKHCQWASMSEIQTALDNLCHDDRARTTGESSKKYHSPKKEKKEKKAAINIPVAVLIAALDANDQRSAAQVLSLLPSEYSHAGPARVAALLDILRQQGTHGVKSTDQGINRNFWKDSA